MELYLFFTVSATKKLPTFEPRFPLQFTQCLISLWAQSHPWEPMKKKDGYEIAALM